jgi:hypothetical protein
MTPTDDKSDALPEGAAVLSFPQSRVAPRASDGGFKELGMSDLARDLGAPGRQGTGHWCSRCQGIWYGYLLEVACPRCGGRHG